jgi:glycosyltransferase involved in cell wall biosynthesis
MILVPPGDPEALAAEIDGLLDTDWGGRIGAAAQATVDAHFSWEACGRTTVAAYAEALASGPPARGRRIRLDR